MSNPKTSPSVKRNGTSTKQEITPDTSGNRVPSNNIATQNSASLYIFGRIYRSNRTELPNTTIPNIATTPTYITERQNETSATHATVAEARLITPAIIDADSTIESAIE